MPAENESSRMFQWQHDICTIKSFQKGLNLIKSEIGVLIIRTPMFAYVKNRLILQKHEF